MANFVAYGTFTSGTGILTPPLPTGWAVDDLLILAIESPNVAISLASGVGWTEVGSQASQSSGTANSALGIRLAVYYKFAGAGEVSPTITAIANHQTAQIVAFRNINKTTPFDVTSVSKVVTTGTALSLSAITTTTNNAIHLDIIGEDRDATSSANFSAWTNASLASITEIWDQSILTGVGGGLAWAYGTKVSAGLCTATTVTAVASNSHAFLTLALRSIVYNFSGNCTSTNGSNSTLSTHKDGFSGTTSTIGTQSSYSYSVDKTERKYGDLTSTIGFNNALVGYKSGRSPPVTSTNGNQNIVVGIKKIQFTTNSTIGTQNTLISKKTITKSLTSTLGFNNSITSKKTMSVVFTSSIGTQSTYTAFKKIQNNLTSTNGIQATIIGKKISTSILSSSIGTLSNINGKKTYSSTITSSIGYNTIISGIKKIQNTLSSTNGIQYSYSYSYIKETISFDKIGSIQSSIGYNITLLGFKTPTFNLLQSIGQKTNLIGFKTSSFNLIQSIGILETIVSYKNIVLELIISIGINYNLIGSNKLPFILDTLIKVVEYNSNQISMDSNNKIYTVNYNKNEDLNFIFNNKDNTVNYNKNEIIKEVEI